MQVKDVGSYHPSTSHLSSLGRDSSPVGGQQYLGLSSNGSFPGAVPTGGYLCLHLCLCQSPSTGKGAWPCKVLMDGPWLAGRWERSPEPGWPMFPGPSVSVGDTPL